jgi:hypothetical protein
MRNGVARFVSSGSKCDAADIIPPCAHEQGYAGTNRYPPEPDNEFSRISPRS